MIRPLRRNAAAAIGVTRRSPVLRCAQASLAALVVLLAFFAARARAQDRADIDPTQIIGNRELPKALYIVPWKKPLPGDLAGKPPASVIDEALAPIDRDVFRRQVQYDALERAHLAAANSPATAAASAPGASAH
jgi:hypothetical protein